MYPEVLWALKGGPHHTFAEEEMELAWELRGYAINISVLRRRAVLSKVERTEEQIVEPGRPHRPAEKAYHDLLQVSGSRYVGPMR